VKKILRLERSRDLPPARGDRPLDVITAGFCLALDVPCRVGGDARAVRAPLPPRSPGRLPVQAEAGQGVPPDASHQGDRSAPGQLLDAVGAISSTKLSIFSVVPVISMIIELRDVDDPAQEDRDTRPDSERCLGGACIRSASIHETRCAAR